MVLVCIRIVKYASTNMVGGLNKLVDHRFRTGLIILHRGIVALVMETECNRMSSTYFRDWVGDNGNLSK